MYTTLVIICFLVVLVQGGDPKRCCMPDEWSSYLADFVPVAKGKFVFNTYAYSFKLKKVAVSTFKFMPGDGREGPSKLIVRSVFDYTRKKVFFINPDGSCRSKPNTDKLRKPCIPDDAVYLGSNYFGFASFRLLFDAWRFQYKDSPKANITIAFTQDTCVPIMEGVTGEFTGEHIETSYVFSGYEPEVKDKSVFDVPKGC